MRHPRGEPSPDTDCHLHKFVAESMKTGDACCWRDPDGHWWRVDMVDGVAVTWYEGAPEKVPF